MGVPLSDQPGKVETFGSLNAAFEEFDLHGRDEITRSQWDAALNARGWNTEEF